MLKFVVVVCLLFFLNRIKSKLIISNYLRLEEIIDKKKFAYILEMFLVLVELETARYGDHHVDFVP